MQTMRPGHSVALLSVGLLCACASQRGTPDNEPTLKTLAGRTVVVDKDQRVVASETQAIEAYQRFLEVAPKAPQRAEATRRIGDLEMDRADSGSGSASSPTASGPDYRAAIARYEEVLKTYPSDPANDRVLYQLARAQEQGGDLAAALKTLDLLVKSYPTTAFRDEAQFRRGELLFTARDYVSAEKAYATVLRAGPANRYHDRALYMQGWSQFKQGRLDEALHSFFGVLDLKVAGREGEGGLDTLVGLSRADRELADDTFRVTSLSLTNLQGAESIPAYIDSAARRSYEFRVYEQLGELYLKQDRVKDAADTFGLFARRNPLHAQAPVLQARVIGIYERAGFATLALEAKKEYVARYGSASDFRSANAQGWERAQPLVKTLVAELASHYHASAQKSKSTADYEEAVHWYRESLASFPSDPGAARTRFLLAEVLFEDGRFRDAGVEYQKTAYDYPVHAKSADAGYAALLCYAQQQKTIPSAERVVLQRESVASALHFADAFPSDPRAAPVLADAAEKLYALPDAGQAARVAQRVLDLQPAAADAQRRTAWTVLAHTAFERGAFDRSEAAYAEVLKITPVKDAGRNELVERQAAAIYKQGEQARAAGQSRDAVGHFARVASVAPQSTVRAAAQYDAAAALIALKDWDAATRTLEDFRQRFPGNPLQAEVGAKLAVAYLEKGQWAGAAGEFERLAATTTDPAIARDALWQAAEFHEKAGARALAAKAYERYLAQNPQPLVPALEARWRLARIAKEDGNAARELALMKDIFQADQSGGTARTDRTRYLGASAALALAEPVADAYRKVALTEPLQKQLKLKKARMEETLKAYAVAADYGVADVTTAATYRIAVVYRDFGKALMASERPKKLSKAEREQYDVLLEEQAFPFEEKAAQYHELNTRRTLDGLYDPWVQRSFDALRELRPVRYGKAERVEGVVDAIR
jgi:tetratricopeptide (TPR) repeat protein